LTSVEKQQLEIK